LRGEITAEQLTSFLFYIEFVVQSALASSEQVANINTAVGSSERVLTLLRRKPDQHLAAGEEVEEEDRGSKQEMRRLEDFKGNLEFKDVSFTYPNLNLGGAGGLGAQQEVEKEEEPKMTLRKINLSLKPGTVTALVGPSGGGKSTLVALLQSLYQPTSGQILADGVPIETIDPEWYRSQIGYVEQEPKLFDLPIGENVEYGAREWTEGEIVPIDKVAVENAAREANALEFIEDLPEYLDTWVGNSTLSGGQRQRIALARALIRSPKILILDEATSALDAESEFQVQRALNKVFNQKDKSVLVIAHKLSTVTSADNILVLKDGEVVEQGTHLELTAADGVYAKLASRQGVVDLAPHCEPPTEKMKQEQKEKERREREEEMAEEIKESLDESVDQPV